MNECYFVDLYGVIIKLVYKDVLRISITVRPNGSVIVNVPLSVDKNTAINFAKSKFDWIKHHLDEYKSDAYRNAHPTLKERSYHFGEQFEILGKTYTLRVERGKIPYVNVNDGYLDVYVQDVDDPYRIKRAVLKFYESVVKEKTEYYLAKYYAMTGLRPEKTVYKNIKTAWGKCWKDRKQIEFSYTLATRPEECIEYVVLHELVHLLYSNHGIEFKNTMSKYMSDWKTRKEILNEDELHYSSRI